MNNTEQNQNTQVRIEEIQIGNVKSKNFDIPLWGCFLNINICVLGYLCPCYVQGKVAEKIGEEAWLHALIFFIPFANLFFAVKNRTVIREMAGIPGTLAEDTVTYFFCFCCALVQDATEVGVVNPMCIDRV